MPIQPIFCAFFVAIANSFWQAPAANFLAVGVSYHRGRALQRLAAAATDS
jgi:hypothetical protein